ncbi:MAG: sulfatase, partial [Planctomycetota bacterium]
VALPEDAQVLGRNRVHFEFEQLNFRYKLRGGDPQAQRFSVLFRPFELRPQDESDLELWTQLSSLGPLGSRPGVDVEGLAFVDQAPGSILAYHLDVPPGGRFYSRLAVAPLESGEAGSGRLSFEVQVTGDQGEPSSFASGTVNPSSDPVELSFPLEGFEEQLVRLDLRVTADNGAGRERLVRWTAPRVVVEAEELQAAAKRELAGSDRDRLEALLESTEGAPVVMILIDACNASFISSYGGREGLTPNIDRLASEGARFTRAYATASYTISSLASMFTSQWAWQHGSYTQTNRLGSTVPVWPERFSEDGYRTVSIVHSPFGSSQLGYGRGFEEKYDVYRNEGRTRPPLATDALPALDEALANDDGRPLFLWMHIVEPHRPYSPPAPFAGQYSSGLNSELDGTTDSSNRVKDRVFEMSEEDIAYQKAIYEENLAYVDQVLGEVRTRLEAAGIFDEAIVCLFSDHGEGFLEHEGKTMPGLGHGMQTYNDMTRIPLIFRFPERSEVAGLTPRSVASTIDLLPTVADLAGLEGLPHIPGQSLARAMSEPESDLRRSTVAHSYVQRPDRFLPMWGHWWEDYKLVFHPYDAPELYDLSVDPDETHDIAAERPVLTGFMLQQLSAMTGLDVRRGELNLDLVQGEEFDAATTEQLRALGYIR